MTAMIKALLAVLAIGLVVGVIAARLIDNWFHQPKVRQPNGERDHQR